MHSRRLIHCSTRYGNSSYLQSLVEKQINVSPQPEDGGVLAADSDWIPLEDYWNGGQNSSTPAVGAITFCFRVSFNIPQMLHVVCEL